jgi:ethanolaminephosphotransferase
LKYNTGVLYLPWGYDLGMWGSVAIYVINYVFGTEIWKIPILGSSLSGGHFIEAFLYFGAMSNLPMVFYNLYRSYNDKTGKMRSFTESMRPLVPLFFFLAVSSLWVHKSPNRIVETDPRAV